MRAMLVLLLTLMLATPAAARSDLRIEKVVLLYRHGVRAPLDTEAALDGVAHPALPAWPVEASLLTPHGAKALAAIGAWRRQAFVRAGLWSRHGCPGPDRLAIWTNTASRTIASGQALADGLAPGCAVAIGHLAAGQTDPLFEPMHLGLFPFDGAAAVASAEDYTGGTRALTARHAGELRTLARVIGCDAAARPCDLASDPGSIGISDDKRDISLTGAIRLYSGTAQVLLLQYLEGLPLAQVGWGRASAETLRQLGPLHAALFDVYTRPPYMAARVAGPLARRIAATLTDRTAARVSLFVGHDSNIAALAALLGVQVAAPGYAPGDPPPGGALIIEVLRDGAGRRWVRLSFEAALPDQIRNLAPLTPARPPGRQSIPMPTCRPAGRGATAGLCPLETFRTMIADRSAG